MDSLKTSDFDYSLPQELIAQTPIEPRDSSNLLVLSRRDSLIGHRKFRQLIEYLKPGDVMVFNNSRVIRARLFGTRLDSGKKVEILLLRRLSGTGEWETLIRSKKKVEAGIQIQLNDDSRVGCEVVSLLGGGIRTVRFSDESILPAIGEVPLPPYIHAPLTNSERYQTVYAHQEGSVAAPTAGLHFTLDLLDKIKAVGVECLFVTLHVGLNTFRPVRAENAFNHPIFPEYGVVEEVVVQRINRAKAEGRRVICVGTTSVRLIESAAQASLKKSKREQMLEPFEGWADLFIYPGYRFEIVDSLITNFHLPRSTLLMLVSAFAGRELVLKAYEEAIKRSYRFYSFGDAMLII